MLLIISYYQFNNSFLTNRNTTSFKYMHIDCKNYLNFRMLKCGRKNVSQVFKNIKTTISRALITTAKVKI